MRLLTLALVALCAAQAAQAGSVYTAFATSDTADGVAEVTIAFAISGAAFSFNLTGAAPDGAISAAIVDGNPAVMVTPVVSLWPATVASVADADGAFETDGRLAAADVSTMPLEELAGHMGMGHIYLEVTTPDGKLYGAFEEADTASNTAHGHAHNEEDGAHAHEEDGGHSHRRLLRA